MPAARRGAGQARRLRCRPHRRARSGERFHPADQSRAGGRKPLRRRRGQRLHDGPSSARAGRRGGDLASGRAADMHLHALPIVSILIIWFSVEAAIPGRSDLPLMPTEMKNHKWMVLSNTTLGMLAATIIASIVLISLPAIFRGIGLKPLDPGNTNILLWTIMGYMVVTSVLVVSFGRLGDMFGRAKIYNLGFLVFTLASLGLSFMPTGDMAGWFLVGMRVVQGIGGAMLTATSTAILIDVFPAKQRGLALGINIMAAIAGQFVGLVLGGLLADIDWRLIFRINVPIGIIGTVWAYVSLKDIGVERKHGRLDWWGNITFAIGLILVLVGINDGIQPYGHDLMAWGSPRVLGELAVGILFLIAFMVIETRVEFPMIDLKLFRIRPFTTGVLATLLGSV